MRSFARSVRAGLRLSVVFCPFATGRPLNDAAGPSYCCERLGTDPLLVGSWPGSPGGGTGSRGCLSDAEKPPRKQKPAINASGITSRPKWRLVAMLRCEATSTKGNTERVTHPQSYSRPAGVARSVVTRRMPSQNQL